VAVTLVHTISSFTPAGEHDDPAEPSTPTNPTTRCSSDMTAATKTHSASRHGAPVKKEGHVDWIYYLTDDSIYSNYLVDDSANDDEDDWT
jgi:hypothetical protein